MTTRLLPLLTPNGPAAEHYFVPEAKRLSGNPRQSLWPHYTNEAGSFFTGVWESEPGKWRIEYTEEEFCEILSGRSVITDAAGVAVAVNAGDRFVIPKGFVGSWEVIETTRKVYVIHEAKA